MRRPIPLCSYCERFGNRTACSSRAISASLAATFARRIGATLRAMDLAVAHLSAVLHGAFIVFLVGGGVACLRWPSLLRFHIPAVIAMATVNLLGWECP